MSADPEPGGPGPAEPRKRPRLLRAHWLVWLFAAVGLTGILCIIALTVIIIGLDRPRETAKVADQKNETVFVVGGPEDLAGTNLMHLPVSASVGRGGGSMSSGSRDDQRNVLLIDKLSGASRRILPDNAHRIVSEHFLPAKAEVSDKPRDDGDAALMGKPAPSKTAPIAYYMLVLEQGKGSELQQILVGTLAGGRQGVVMEGLDGVDNVWMQGPTQIGLLVRERLGLYYRVVDIPSLKVVQSRRIVID
ncbi:MAG TPA: hypothetical protein VGC56_08760 [Allosphingosinicella sp.]|jgi:hypothetical protein